MINLKGKTKTKKLAKDVIIKPKSKRSSKNTRRGKKKA